MGDPGRLFLVSHLLGASLGWASGFLFVKLAGAEVPPAGIAAARGLVAALTLAVVFLVQGRSLRPRGREWRDWAVLGTLNGWAPNILTAYALTQISTPSAAMIQASGPLMVAVLAHFLFAEERLTPGRGFGVLVGFTGMGVLIGPAAFGAVSAWGALLMLTTAALYAVGNVYVRTIPVADPLRLAFGQQAVSGPIAAVVAGAVLGSGALAGFAAKAPWLLLLGVFGTALPILFFMRLIRGAGPTRAAMVGYLVPVWATGLAILVLNEGVGLREMLGGTIVLAGVAIVSGAARQPRPA